jgi:hypothetical protein
MAAEFYQWLRSLDHECDRIERGFKLFNSLDGGVAQGDQRNLHRANPRGQKPGFLHRRSAASFEVQRHGGWGEAVARPQALALVAGAHGSRPARGRQSPGMAAIAYSVSAIFSASRRLSHLPAGLDPVECAGNPDADAQ